MISRKTRPESAVLVRLAMSGRAQSEMTEIAIGSAGYTVSQPSTVVIGIVDAGLLDGSIRRDDYDSPDSLAEFGLTNGPESSDPLELAREPVKDSRTNLETQTGALGIGDGQGPCASRQTSATHRIIHSSEGVSAIREAMSHSVAHLTDVAVPRTVLAEIQVEVNTSRPQIESPRPKRRTAQDVRDSFRGLPRRVGGNAIRALRLQLLEQVPA